MQLQWQLVIMEWHDPQKKIKMNDTTQVSNSTAKEAGTSNKPDAKVDGSMKEMVTQYLQMKNALANDNGKDAASAGKAFVESMGNGQKLFDRG